MPTPIEQFQKTLQDNAADFGLRLSNDSIEKLNRYYELLLNWNDRLHLVAPCSPQEFATRHVLESIMVINHLSPDARVVDIGSGAGLPVIPCLIARPDVCATLIESSAKKAVFLREALRGANCQSQAQLIVERFQQTATPDADFVTCRALDRFPQVLPILIEWSPPTSTLLLFAGESLSNQIKAMLPSAKVEKIPNSERRFLIIGMRQPRA